jgi:1-deoxy-D-xylulose 5-phosphate reductoisomerase
MRSLLIGVDSGTQSTKVLVVARVHCAIGKLTFQNPDHDRFPCLGYGYDALRVGGTMPAPTQAAPGKAKKKVAK